jgi:hypothetical protein
VPAFGCKNHVSIDRRHGLIRRWTATDATTHDGARLAELIDDANTASDVWVDTAHRSARNETMLAGRGLVSGHSGAARAVVTQRRPGFPSPHALPIQRRGFRRCPAVLRMRDGSIAGMAYDPNTQASDYRTLPQCRVMFVEQCMGESDELVTTVAATDAVPVQRIEIVGDRQRVHDAAFRARMVVELLKPGVRVQDLARRDAAISRPPPATPSHAGKH